MTRLINTLAPTEDATPRNPPLTSGALAMINLQAQIDGLERQAMAGRLAAVSDRAALIELVALRGQVLGCIRDYEWAEDQAEKLTYYAPTDGAAFLALSRARGRFHRFGNALADLDRAQQFGGDPVLVDAERASMYQAIGVYEPALEIYNEAAKRQADFESLSALAMLHAERREIVTAEELFDESRDHYREVSPFPLALLDFQRGLMWVSQGDLHQALTWFEAAVRLLPAYAPAQGHLAEVQAAMGEREAAITRLLPLTSSSDDPDYASSLARILKEAGRMEEGCEWRNRAAARYDELIGRHPEAFADHAAEFWLEAGEDPHQALRLARMNLEIRKTARARELFSRAVSATTEGNFSSITT